MMSFELISLYSNVSFYNLMFPVAVTNNQLTKIAENFSKWLSGAGMGLL